MHEKIAWQGTLVSVQLQIRLTRSFDQRSHSYLGFVLRVQETVGGEEREFLVGIGSGGRDGLPGLTCCRSSARRCRVLDAPAAESRFRRMPGEQDLPDRLLAVGEDSLKLPPDQPIGDLAQRGQWQPVLHFIFDHSLFMSLVKSMSVIWGNG